MLASVKDKVFVGEFYRPITKELLERLKSKIKWVTMCPACGCIVGLNVFGILVDKFEIPTNAVLKCKECEAVFSEQLFIM